ncbi:unnamed protein product [Lupinus luteus]|uniref:Uncharacterized protein n=1 Tax=Lupinus luteus TaxID=3873 RepID=A0AAV1XMK2_LUPLU
MATSFLHTTLEKPLNNPKIVGKTKKLKEPKFSVEIPLIDDSPDSLSQLALDTSGDISIKRNGSPIKILIMWPDSNLKKKLPL